MNEIYRWLENEVMEDYPPEEIQEASDRVVRLLEILTGYSSEGID